MTFAQMYALLAEELEDESYNTWSLVTLKKYLNLANEKLHLYLYEMHEWKITSTTKTTTKDQQADNLPADFLYMRRVWRDGEGDLHYEHGRKLGTDSTDTGEPTKYYVDGSNETTGASPTVTFAQIHWKPIPAAAYAISYEYFPIPTEMTRDTDVSPIPSMFHDIIIRRAGMMAYTKKGMTKMRQAWAEEYEKGLAEMELFFSRRQKQELPDLTEAFEQRSYHGES